MHLALEVAMFNLFGNFKKFSACDVASNSAVLLFVVSNMVTSNSLPCTESTVAKVTSDKYQLMT
jgi:hypothetical protein